MSYIEPRSSEPHTSRILAPKLFRWLVTSRPPGLLLPNITRFAWPEGIPYPYYRSASMFFGRRLMEVRIGRNGRHREHAEAIASMLQSIPKCSPKVQDLTVITEQRVGPGIAETSVNAFQSALGHVLTALTGLRRMTLNLDHSVAPENVIKLSSLPCLRSFRVIISSDDPFSTEVPLYTVEGSNTHERTFPALRALHITSGGLDKCVLVLSHFCFPSLAEIYLRCPECSNSVAFESAFERLGVICPAELLETISISTGDRDVEDAQASAGCVTMAVLRHICAFRNLRTVDIFTELSIVLDDDEIRDLVTSWPQLEVLKLITVSDYSEQEYAWRQQTRVTLRGLALVVQHCPSLSGLGIDVDTQDCNIPTDDAAVRYCNPRIQRLSFSQSRLLGDPEKKATAEV